MRKAIYRLRERMRQKRDKGNVPLSDRQKSELRRKKKDLRALSLKKTSLQQKRRILQKGGFLTALLPPILAFLGSLFAK